MIWHGNIYIIIWTPTDKGLTEFLHVVLTYHFDLDPIVIKFPSMYKIERHKIEKYNVSATVIMDNDEELNTLYSDSYVSLVSVFDIHFLMHV